MSKRSNVVRPKAFRKGAAASRENVILGNFGTFETANHRALNDYYDGEAKTALEEIELLRQRAMAGEIIGIAYAVIKRPDYPEGNPSIATGWSEGVNEHAFASIAAVDHLSHRLSHSVWEDH